MSKIRIDNIIVGAGNIGKVGIPDKAIVVEIRNLGTHGAIDAAFINDVWQINGGESEIPGQFYQASEHDETDWYISWAATAIDFRVMFIFKIPV